MTVVIWKRFGGARIVRDETDIAARTRRIPQNIRG
jgi:hypothetical protein